MSQRILPGIAAAALLAGCAADTSAPAPAAVQPVAAKAAVPACTRGAIDSQRSFILCPAASSSLEDASRAMASPADLSLNIATVASDYGIARQSVTGIEAATYARIVGKTKEAKPRSSSSNAITIGGEQFRKVSLNADDKKPVVLFIQR